MGSDDLQLRVENQPMNPIAPQLASAMALGPGIAPGGHLPRIIMPSTSSLVRSPTRQAPTTWPFFTHRHAVGEVEHLVDVVTDEEDAEALRLELLDELADLRGLGRPQRRRRLMRPTEALRGGAHGGVSNILSRWNRRS